VYCAGCKDVQVQSFNRPVAFLRKPEEVRIDLEEIKKYAAVIMFDSDIPLYDFTDYFSDILQGIDLSRHFCDIYLWQLPSPDFIRLLTDSFKYIYINIDMCSLSERHRLKLHSMGIVKKQVTDDQLFSFLNACEKYPNLEVTICLISGLPYFTDEDITTSNEALNKIIEDYSCFSHLEWGRLHAQPGAPITRNPRKYGMNLCAKTFDEFLKYSEHNLNEPLYPTLDKVHYPFIYSRNDVLNSRISRFYFETNATLEKKHPQPGEFPTGSRRLSYAALNRKANRLAQILRERGVTPETIVAVMAYRSVEMIVGILGILKAGGAYLPVAPDYPAARIKYILENSGAAFIIGDSTNIGSMTVDIPNTIAINCDNEGREGTQNPEVPMSASNAAYVIYTSGTTGRPKGVVVEHKHAVNTLVHRKKEYRMDSSSKSLQLFSYAFDGFVTSFFTPIISGAEIILLTEEQLRDITKIKQTILENKVTHFISVPTMYAAIIEALSVEEAAGLKVVTLAGDMIAGNALEITTRKNNHLEIAHEYGVTEAAVMSTIFRNQEKTKEISIGRPVPNTMVYIVDKFFRPQPVGVPGEMLLSGAGVARGYLNRPEMTDGKFIHLPQNPATRHPGSAHLHSGYAPHHNGRPPAGPSGRMYRTGDLARWKPDGNIEFLGRVDNQVKIRGFRIEIAEIQNHLTQIDEVREAVIIIRESGSGDRYLCAYIVSNQPLNSSELRNILAEDLPHYMIPAYFIPIDTIPLTPNGKIDRDALPDPKTISADRKDSMEKEYSPPQTEAEEILVKIWQLVLDIEKIGTDDDFFYLGGDSIKAIQIISKLQKHTFKLEVNHLFRYRTVRHVSKHLETVTTTGNRSREPVEGDVPLTPIQHWLFHQHPTGISHFNQSMILSRREGFDQKKLEAVFSAIVMHNDALRMVYNISNSHVNQVNRGCEEPLFHLDAIPVDDNNYAETIRENARTLQGAFNLSSGPLAKALLFKGNQYDHLLIVIHHLVVDGVSWRILLEDFETAYHQLEEGKPIQLHQKTDSFQKWARVLNKFARGKLLLDQIPYWKAVEETPLTLFPPDHELPPVPGKEIPSHGKGIQAHGDEPQSHHYGGTAHAQGPVERKHKDIVRISVKLDDDKTKLLLTKANWAYNTEINDILLTALGLAVNHCRRIDIIRINLEGHGRENISPDVDVSRTVGWFTSQYPVILDMRKNRDISQALIHIKETLRRVPLKGIGYEILKRISPDAKSHTIPFRPPPEIAFNYLGRFDHTGFSLADKMSGLSDPGMGETIHPLFLHDHMLNVMGITADHLEMSFFYNKYEFEEDTIRRLADSFLHTLEAIISHCLAQSARTLTPSDLGYNKISTETLHQISLHIKESIDPKAKIVSIYPLTPMQKLIYADSVGNRNAFFIQNLLSIPAWLDGKQLEAAFNFLLKRYEVTRTIFFSTPGCEPLQMVLDRRRIHLVSIDISYLDKEARETRIQQLAQKDQAQGFDLLSGQLPIRITLIKTGELTDRLIWSLHHITMDGWCFGIIMDDLSRVYRSLEVGRKKFRLDALTPYRSYIDWLGRQDEEKGYDYWRKYLHGYTGGPMSVCGLRRSKRKQNTGNRYKSAEHFFNFDELMTDNLTEAAVRHHVTLNTLFQALWALLMQKYTGNKDILFGGIVAGRSAEIEGIESMVGLFINIIPVRIRIDEPVTFHQLLKKIQQQSISSKPYEYLSLEHILENSGLDADAVDNVMFFENYRLPKRGLINAMPGQGGRIPGGRSKKITAQWLENHEQFNYDFNIYILPGAPLSVRFSYNSTVYSREFVAQLAGELKDAAARFTAYDK
ncbi:MAG: amino acid adenylation domain-containing protein, partial [bacterium]|nr:amino acid adenylation domain-containing protein [bacterium]